MKFRTGVLFAAAFALSAVSAWAHHNMSAVFDFNQRFTRTGTLSRVDWRNPHISLFVDAKNDQGMTETWTFEGPAPIVFKNLNVSKEDVIAALGKTLTVEASRARDGSLAGLMRTLTLPDGKVVGLCPQNC